MCITNLYVRREGVQEKEEKGTWVATLVVLRVNVSSLAFEL